MTTTASVANPTDPQPTYRSENKFYAFFRSRSRSRSRTRLKTNPTPSDPLSMSSKVEPLAPTNNLYARRAGFTKDLLSSDMLPSSYAKSSSQSQTRPISSTTTATHSTIAPLPSDSFRRRMNRTCHEYASRPESIDTHHSSGDHDQRSDNCEHYDEHRPSRSETPSSTRRKLALHTIFGISLTRRSSSSGSTHHPSTTSQGKTSISTTASETKNRSSRKRSFRLTSRPPTPKSTDEPASKSPYSIPVPSSPLPLSASPRRRSFGLGMSSQRSTPKSSTGHLPLPPVHSGQGDRAHGRTHSVSSERTPHDSAVALSEEHEDGSAAQRGAHKSGYSFLEVGRRNSKWKEKHKLSGDPEGRHLESRPSTEFVSQSMPSNPSPITRIYPSSQSYRDFGGSADGGRPQMSQLPTVESSEETEEQPPYLAPRPILAIPLIVHTPPTPQRPGEVDSPLRSATAPPRVNSGKVKIAKGRPVNAAHREQVLVSSSRSHTEAGSDPSTSSKGRFTPRLFGGKDLPKAKDAGGQKSNGRADAGTSSGQTHNAHSSGNFQRNMTSHRIKLGSFDFERPVSTLNGSSSSIGQSGSHASNGDTSTHSRASNSKARRYPLERTTSGDSARAGKSSLTTFHPARAESPMLSHLKPDHTGDTSVVSFSSVSVQSKSTGRGIGASTAAGHSSSWGRVSGRHNLRTSHGTFAFENPSSVSNSPIPKTTHLPSSSALPSNQRDLPVHVLGLGKSRPTSPLHIAFDTRLKHFRGQSYNTSEHADMNYSKRGECTTKGKGRSLDLGLGLSWAPSRMREEAVMPGSTLAREKARAENGRAYGSDVTKVFESLLSDSGFQAFKKCKDLLYIFLRCWTTLMAVHFF
ncbi:hypothetical protein PAXRUDRAFT_269247 [Paxillus rubicundulus Ve08.2h10]|uniref:Uncharacterized protein n=1 Tax=Paxillus rubicundulus Ve08.2h10 TaxID=930991 RepID=A0A0D0DF85_9AGAM|nr:hypothetical protein PAXRUDRAFT_269247 [Paxillus rubicundulus Ve08.2h10]